MDRYAELTELLNHHPKMRVTYIGPLRPPDPMDPYWIENPRGPGVVFRGRWEIEGYGVPHVEVPFSEDLLENGQPDIVAELLLSRAEDALELLIKSPRY